MVIGIPVINQVFSYPQSILNPLLKILILIIFGIATYYYYRAYKRFGGNLKKISWALMWGGVAGCIAAGFRLLGDYWTEFKWIESIGGLIFAVVSVFVAYLVYTKLEEIAEAFGLAGEK
ncbi:MAG: hypothetical protein A4E35_00594 [Methanoregula sp. PtaU1.Bin051]|nr:MAG: hypothetical protein A4E35_00594 [Methanoregula sp. PtaU1.Bin051]